MLKTNNSITHLYVGKGCKTVGSNEIGYVGAVALANAIKVNTSITCLNVCLSALLFVDDNSIGHAGITAIARSLENNGKVTNLYLSKQSIACRKYTNSR